MGARDHHRSMWVRPRSRAQIREPRGCATVTVDHSDRSTSSWIFGIRYLRQGSGGRAGGGRGGMGIVSIRWLTPLRRPMCLHVVNRRSLPRRARWLRYRPWSDLYNVTVTVVAYRHVRHVRSVRQRVHPYVVLFPLRMSHPARCIICHGHHVRHCAFVPIHRYPEPVPDAQRFPSRFRFMSFP